LYVLMQCVRRQQAMHLTGLCDGAAAPAECQSSARLSGRPLRQARPTSALPAAPSAAASSSGRRSVKAAMAAGPGAATAPLIGRASASEFRRGSPEAHLSQERQSGSAEGDACEARGTSSACATVRDLLDAPCRSFLFAQMACAALSAVVVGFFAISAFLSQAEMSEADTACEVEHSPYVRVPYFVAMFLAGALLNCREFLSMPLL